MKDEGFYDENYCTQIVDKPLNLLMGKLNKYITISVAPKFIYGVLIPHRNIASSFQLTSLSKQASEWDRSIEAVLQHYVHL